MIIRYGPPPGTGMMKPSETESIRPSTRRPIMKWETPEAIDMRFGMEITMYISNR